MSGRPLLSAATALLVMVPGALLLGSPPADASPQWVWPVQGEVLTAYRNGADPYAAGQHRGIDIAAEVATPVAAAVSGTVRFAGVAGSSGLTVSVRTADGRYDVSYLHLAAADVRKGDQVALGQRLGAVGTSGRRSAERPHLHFGVRDAGTRHSYRDPLAFLAPLAPGPGPRTTPPASPAPVSVEHRPDPVPPPARRPSPVRGPVPVRRPSPVRVPGARRTPAPAGRRVRVPARGRFPAAPDRPRSAAPERVPAPPAAEPVPERRVLPAPGERIGPAPAPNTVARPAPAAGPSPDRRSPAAPAQAAGGPDVGWALACLGLLVAAASLGRPRGAGHPPGAAAPARPRRTAGSAAVKLRSLLG